MKVAIPTDDGVKVSKHFGKSRFIYISDGKESKLIENPHVPGKGHRQLPDLLKKEGVEVAFAKHVGEGMRRNLESAGIKIEIVSENDISKILERIREDP